MGLTYNNIDMKQTLEEAINEIGGVHPDWDKITCFRIGFKEGARWQAKQSPWISVKERLPNNDENIFYTNHLSGALGVGFYVDEKWYQAYTGEDIYGITHWMPIPSLRRDMQKI